VCVGVCVCVSRNLRHLSLHHEHRHAFFASEQTTPARVRADAGGMGGAKEQPVGSWPPPSHAGHAGPGSGEMARSHPEQLFRRASQRRKATSVHEHAPPPLPDRHTTGQWQYQYLCAAQQILARKPSRVSRHVPVAFEEHEGGWSAAAAAAAAAADGGALPNDRRRRHTTAWVPHNMAVSKGDAGGGGGGGWQEIGSTSPRYHTRMTSKRSEVADGARGLRHASVAEAFERAERTAAAEGGLGLLPNDRRRRHTTAWVPHKMAVSKGDAGGGGGRWQEMGSTSPRRPTWRTTAAVNAQSLASVPVGVQLRMQQRRREHSMH
jgi:hypothetical protein